MKEESPILQYGEYLISQFGCTNIIFADLDKVELDLFFKIISKCIRVLLIACLFLWCLHYIKIFLFMFFFHLCGLNSVFWKVYEFFLIWGLIFFPLEFMKSQDIFFMYSRRKNYNLKNIFLMPAILADLRLHKIL